ncbi:MAG: CoA-binding protein [Limnochordales bacterium]
MGLSPDPGRPSHRVARKLQRLGYKIIPVHPKGGTILGETVYARLQDIPVPVDVVQVFRAPDAAPGIAREAAQLPGRPVFWLQEGIESQEAAEIAAGAGLPVVMNRCLWKEVQRLQGFITTYTARAADDGAEGAVAG